MFYSAALSLDSKRNRQLKPEKTLGRNMDLFALFSSSSGQPCAAAHAGSDSRSLSTTEQRSKSSTDRRSDSSASSGYQGHSVLE